jgi:hypothetical protein
MSKARKLTEQQCRDFYSFSMKHLELIAQSRGIAPEELEEYFTPDHTLAEMKKVFSMEFRSMKDIEFITCRLFYSLQNSGYRNFVKLGEQVQVETFKDLLCGFNPKDVLRKYITKEKFLDAAMAKRTELGINDNNKKAWHGFFDGVYDSMKKFTPFNDADQFFRETVKSEGTATKDIIDYLLREPKPKGLGKAIAADFIKESKLADTGKPDVHILAVLKGISAIDENKKATEEFDNAQTVLKQIAETNNTTMYKIDKIIWLICTKNFYLYDLSDDRTNYIKMLNEAML